MVTGLVVVVIWSYLTLRDWRVGAAFLGAAVWAMANIVAWSMLIVTATSREVPAKPMKVMLLVLLKLTILIGGPVSLVWLRPTTRAQIFGVLGGISVVIVVIALKAAGSWITGSDIFEGRAKFPLSARRSRSESK